MNALTLDPEATRATQASIARARAAGPFVDAHVHPFDVLVGGHRYRSRPDRPGVYGAYGGDYQPPRRGDVARDPAAREGGALSPELAAKFFLLTVRRVYAHTGPTVLADHLELAHIDRCLLLPVTRGGDDGQLGLMSEMFGDDPRFVLGACVPDTVPDDRVADTLAAMVDAHDARVLKIHPAVSGIDLREAPCRARMERLLRAAGALRLGVVVHGGLSPQAPDPEAVAFGALDRLEQVDWSLAGTPVVIAHAGAFGYPAGEVGERVLPALEGLLGRHGNLRVDVAGLGVEAMAAVLERVGVSRVLFGSDALYYSPWETMVRLALALESAGFDVVDGLRVIAGRNPVELLGPGEKAPCDGC